MSDLSFVNINAPETPTEEMIAFVDRANEWAMQRVLKGLVGVSIRMDEQMEINRRIALKNTVSATEKQFGEKVALEPIPSA